MSVAKVEPKAIEAAARTGKVAKMLARLGEEHRAAKEKGKPKADIDLTSKLLQLLLGVLDEAKVSRRTVVQVALRILAIAGDGRMTAEEFAAWADVESLMALKGGGSEEQEAFGPLQLLARGVVELGHQQALSPEELVDFIRNEAVCMANTRARQQPQRGSGGLL